MEKVRTKPGSQETSSLGSQKAKQSAMELPAGQFTQKLTDVKVTKSLSNRLSPKEREEEAKLTFFPPSQRKARARFCRVRAQQLAEITKLMEGKEMFGNLSTDDIQDQLKLYSF